MTTEQKEKREEEAATEPKETGLLGKIGWSLAIPCVLPFFFNLGGKYKLHFAAGIFALGLGYNIYQVGMLSSASETYQRTDIKNVPFLLNERFVTREKSNWDIYTDKNAEEQSLLRFLDFGALLLSPIYVAYRNMDKLMYSDQQGFYFEDRYPEAYRYFFEASFSLTSGSVVYSNDRGEVTGECDLRIYDLKKGDNFIPKAFYADSYETYGGREVCEHAFGEKRHKMGEDHFGWAKQQLESELAEVRKTATFQRAEKLHKLTVAFEKMENPQPAQK